MRSYFDNYTTDTNTLCHSTYLANRSTNPSADFQQTHHMDSTVATQRDGLIQQQSTPLKFGGAVWRGVVWPLYELRTQLILYKASIHELHAPSGAE